MVGVVPGSRFGSVAVRQIVATIETISELGEACFFALDRKVAAIAVLMLQSTVLTALNAG